MPSSAPRIRAGSSAGVASAGSPVRSSSGSSRSVRAGPVSSSSLQQRPVHQPEIVQVAPGHHQLVADPEPAAADRPPVRVETVAERDVERVDPDVAAVDGREHLDVAHGIDAVMGGEPLGHERDDLLERVGGARTLDQEQVPAHLPRRREGRRLAAPDRVRALHDHASRRLAEDVRQPRRRHRVRGDQLGERLAGADRSKLIGVADEHDVRLGADGAQQRDEQLEVRHRRLVDDQQVAAQRVVLVVGGALARNPPERGVDRGGAHPARLVHPDRRASGRGDQQHARALTRGGGGDRPDRGGLAGPGTAGDQRHAVHERVAGPGQLLVGQRGLRIRVRIAQAVAGAGRRPGRGRARPARPRARRSASGRSTARHGRDRRRRRARRCLARSPPARRGVRSPRSGALPGAGTCCRRARPRTARAARPRALRSGLSGFTPSRCAIWSAIRKPTPNTLVSSYGRSDTTR